MKGNIVLRAKLSGQWPPSLGDLVTVGLYKDVTTKKSWSTVKGDVLRVTNESYQKRVYIRVMGKEVEFTVGQGLCHLYARLLT